MTRASESVPYYTDPGRGTRDKFDSESRVRDRLRCGVQHRDHVVSKQLGPEVLVGVATVAGTSGSPGPYAINLEART
jgi:hypothetical protein